MSLCDCFPSRRSFVTDRADEVDEFAEAVFVERRSGVVFRQDAFQTRVVALDRDHRVINDFADGRLLCAVLEIVSSARRAGPRRYFRRDTRQDLLD